MVTDKKAVVRFDVFEFDIDRLVLRRDGVPIHLQPQPSQVLALLVTDPGHLVTRDELQTTVWTGRVVEFDAGLNFAIGQIRKALGDSADSPGFIETQSGSEEICSVLADASGYGKSCQMASLPRSRRR